MLWCFTTQSTSFSFTLFFTLSFTSNFLHSAFFRPSSLKAFFSLFSCVLNNALLLFVVASHDNALFCHFCRSTLNITAKFCSQVTIVLILSGCCCMYCWLLDWWFYLHSTSYFQIPDVHQCRHSILQDNWKILIVSRYMFQHGLRTTTRNSEDRNLIRYP